MSYIEREALIARLKETQCVDCDCPDTDVCSPICWVKDLMDYLESIPTADVRPVVKAKWEVCGMFDDIGRCSNCHYMFPIETAMTEFHFCPNCGADMRKKEET